MKWKWRNKSNLFSNICCLVSNQKNKNYFQVSECLSVDMFDMSIWLICIIANERMCIRMLLHVSECMRSYVVRFVYISSDNSFVKTKTKKKTNKNTLSFSFSLNFHLKLIFFSFFCYYFFLHFFFLLKRFSIFFA